MTRRNGKPKKIHLDRLQKSSPDDRQLIVELEKRFLTVCELYGRKSGGLTPDIPEHIKKEMVRWRQMAVRHQKGDFRHTPSEMLSVRTVCQWTVDLNCDLRGQERVTIEWPD